MAGVGVEAPSVVAAFELGTIKVTAGERHAAMGAGVLKSEGSALRVAAGDERDLEQHGSREVVAPNTIAGKNPVPEPGKH